MTDTTKFTLFIDKIIAKNCPFAIWSMPESNTVEILISQKEELIYPGEFNRLNGHEGFVFAPYQINSKNPLVILKPGIHKKGFDQILNIDCEIIHPESKSRIQQNAPLIISKEEYLNDIENSILEIKKSKLAKVIVSRLIPHQRKNESWA